MQPKIIDFSQYSFRCSSLGKLMSKPQGGSAMDDYLKAQQKYDSEKEKLYAKLNKAIEARDKIVNKETKTWVTADEKVKKYDSELKSRLISLGAELNYAKDHKDDIRLSKTCISHLLQIYVFEKTGRRRDINNRYIRKGNAMEDAAISVMSDAHDEYYIKNNERRNNGYINGECDIHDPNVRTIDTKCTYDVYSHQAKTVDERAFDYYCQGQGYMNLWNVPKHTVASVLLDTPKDIIEDEKKRLLYAIGSSKRDSVVYQEGCAEIEKAGTFTEIPMIERIYEDTFDYDPEFIKDLYKVLDKCREWLCEYALSEWNRVYNPKEWVPIFKKPEPEIINFKSEAVEVTREEMDKVISDEFNLELPTLKDDKEDTETSKAEEAVQEDIAPENNQDEPAIVLDPVNYDQHEKENGAYPNEDLPVISVVKTESNLLFERIESCTSGSDCTTLYREIKDKFETYPEIKDALIKKRDSFVVQIPEVVPKKATLPTAAVKAEPKPKITLPEPVKVVDNSVLDEKQAKIKEIEEALELCKTSAEVKALFQANEKFILKNSKIRGAINRKGTILTNQEDQSDDKYEL